MKPPFCVGDPQTRDDQIPEKRRMKKEEEEEEHCFSADKCITGFEESSNIWQLAIGMGLLR